MFTTPEFWMGFSMGTFAGWLSYLGTCYVLNKMVPVQQPKNEPTQELTPTEQPRQRRTFWD